MTCLEAQSNIMAFIDGKLPAEEVDPFVRHIRTCKNCSEELEIYYTLVVGMRKLDDNEDLPQNFKQLLEEDLDKAQGKVKKAKRYKISAFSIFFAAAIVFLFIVYGRILQKVYNIEQETIKHKQSETYFYDNFKDYLFFDEEDLVVYVREREATEKVSFYDSLQSYNKLHNYYPMLEDENEDDDSIDINQEVP